MATTGRGSCRFCGAALSHVLVDLGMSPLCENFLAADQLDRMEPFYPLRVWVCGRCFLVQLQEYVSPGEIFGEYAYFSSYSSAWLAHASDYVRTITERLGLGSGSRVIELGSNDGYLLQYFVERGVGVMGIEPAANVAAVARARGIPTEIGFFGEELAADLAAAGVLADLVVGNNVLAQVPEINGFVAGIRRILKPRGVITLEFPHVMKLIEGNQFDTIYHEHFSYFSLHTVEQILAAHGLQVFDVEELWSHGGSLRVFAAPAGGAAWPVERRVAALLERERAAGYASRDGYRGFEERVRETKRKLLRFLIGAKQESKSIAGYGAPGKANTLLNYCGIRTDLLDFTVDRNPYKHGKFTPGTHIPIHPPERLDLARPDYILILPWNLQDEIIAQLAHARAWQARFVIPIPEVIICR